MISPLQLVAQEVQRPARPQKPTEPVDTVNCYGQTCCYSEILSWLNLQAGDLAIFDAVSCIVT